LEQVLHWEITGVFSSSLLKQENKTALILLRTLSRSLRNACTGVNEELCHRGSLADISKKQLTECHSSATAVPQQCHSSATAVPQQCHSSATAYYVSAFFFRSDEGKSMPALVQSLFASFASTQCKTKTQLL